MKKLLITLLFFTSSTACVYASSQDAKTINSTQKSQTTKVGNGAVEDVEDPDLKLSIEELRKKYTIDWLEKKFGNYDNPECTGAPFDEGYEDPQESVNLLCSFLEDQKRKDINSFSLQEIKSAFVSEHYDFGKKSSSLLDPRVNEIIGIVLEYFNGRKYDSLSQEEKVIRNFIYSDKILNPFLKTSSCKFIVRKFRVTPSINCKK